MNYKWNSASAETYAKDFSKLICDEFFKAQTQISGSEILALTEIKQLNLLVLRSLYSKWQEETSRLKSPYFDFEQSDVKTALAEFMNTLSRHISVNKASFEILLAHAVKDTLELCLSPKSYFETLMRHLPEFTLTRSWIETNKKYFQINDAVLGALEAKLSEEKAFANQAIDWVKEFFDQNAGEDASRTLEDFNGILGLNLGSKSTPKSFFEDALNKPSEKTVLKAIPEPKPVIEEIAVPEPQTISSKAHQAPKRESNEPFSLNDKLTGTGAKTLNERIVFDGGKTLLDRHQKSKIESLTTGISLNQRFQFVKNLFGGDMDAYNNNMNALNTYNSLDEVKNHIVEHIAPQYHWDSNTEEMEDFYAFVERKFN